ncbi:hypothetical protein [Desulfuromonas sp. DDH964]|uniref:hypothetical protein n=1 Tax=Desulfuromonas sp. DDH964 TaxID=1823759 RepID=UPI0012FC1557|nr:hypothetical protein [Desulfuromonas sp. DDH964]
MKIACLGWGSLIWDPRGLPVDGKWFGNGPLLPIEFSRESSDGRITLAISDVNVLVRTFWALMDVETVVEAKIELAKREGISERFINKSVGFWDGASGKSQGKCSLPIAEWAESLKIGAVVWTNLKCGFKNSRGEMPNYLEILHYLKGLSPEDQKPAEEYVRRAPIQVDTAFRRNLQKDLGWSPISS